VSTGLLATATAAHAQDAQTCQPGLAQQFVGPHTAVYQTILNTTVPRLAQLIADMAAVHDEATYAPLLTDATDLKNALGNSGRVVLTVPDGTVLLDTSKGNNSYANFVAKAINENHNSRLAILQAQEYPCGVAIETKFSTTDNTNESYLAVRAGTHLDSFGTIRASIKQ